MSEPHKLGHLLGFKKLTLQHDEWIKLFIQKEAGLIRVLMAHRGSYKTTCGLVAVIILLMLYPSIRILIARKSEAMAKKLLQAIDKLLDTDIVVAWMYAAYGVRTLKTDKWNSTQIRLSINTRIRPEPSLTAVGTSTSQTGDHYDYVWSDDIITVKDRYSQKERDSTKNYIHELTNIIEPNGVRTFSGTPWHEKDGFNIFELAGIKIHRFPLGSIVIPDLTAEIIAAKKRITPVSLWAANMLLEHVKDANREFGDIITGMPEPGMVKYWFIDPAFGGKDCTAIWEGCSDGETIWLTWAKMYRRSIAEKYDEIEGYFRDRDISKVFFENTGAQKLIGPEFDRRGIPNEGIPSVTNKFARITNALKPMWDRLRFHPDVVAEQDKITEIEEDQPPVPIVELMEYNIDAEHDDSPDACAGLVNALHKAYINTSSDILDVMQQFT